MKAHRDYLDELKCLFFRFRYPSSSVINDLIRQIFECDLNSALGIECCKIGNKSFGDSRNKLLNAIIDLVQLFKGQRIRLACTVA
jgi:hypothetical protein